MYIRWLGGKGCVEPSPDLSAGGAYRSREGKRDGSGVCMSLLALEGCRGTTPRYSKMVQLKRRGGGTQRSTPPHRSRRMIVGIEEARERMYYFCRKTLQTGNDRHHSHDGSSAGLERGRCANGLNLPTFSGGASTTHHSSLSTIVAWWGHKGDNAAAPPAGDSACSAEGAPGIAPRAGGNGTVAAATRPGHLVQSANHRVLLAPKG